MKRFYDHIQLKTPILSIWFDVNDEGGVTIFSNKYQTLSILEEYMGDHSEFWVIQTDNTTGKELSRHNTRYIASINWTNE